MKKTGKIFSAMLALCLMMNMFVLSYASSDSGQDLRFNDNGKFRILMINDTQDVGKNADKRMIEFIENALDETKPDLVIFDGDQLSHFYVGASRKEFAVCIDKICSLVEKRGIPFAVTLGNHDHDREDTLAEDEQYKLYAAYPHCINKFGTDYFTFNLPVLSSDKTKVAMNIWIMDTNNTADEGGYEGVTGEQVEWYKTESAKLRQNNAGVPVPSLVFQHIPCKEIFSLLKKTDWNTKGAVYSNVASDWYVIDETKVSSGSMGEAPCSENPDRITGEYEAWLECGDIIGAWFAHDHVNNFEGVTDDGIRMGYNGGTGFFAYGLGDERSVRVFDIDESNPADYGTYLVYYKDVVESLSFVFSDIKTAKWLTWIMKPVYAVFGPLIALIK